MRGLGKNRFQGYIDQIRLLFKGPVFYDEIDGVLLKILKDVDRVGCARGRASAKANINAGRK